MFMFDYSFRIFKFSKVVERFYNFSYVEIFIMFYLWLNIIFIFLVLKVEKEKKVK